MFTSKRLRRLQFYLCRCKRRECLVVIISAHYCFWGTGVGLHTAPCHFAIRVSLMASASHASRQGTDCDLCTRLRLGKQKSWFSFGCCSSCHWAVWLVTSKAYIVITGRWDLIDHCDHHLFGGSLLFLSHLRQYKWLLHSVSCIIM